MKTFIIGLDFDGTCASHAYPKVGKALPESIKYIKQFIEKGAKIILYTIRDDKELQDAIDFLDSHEITPWAINENPDQKKWNNSQKIYADLYIDDRNFGCPLVQPANNCVDWSKVGPAVMKILEERK
jgi:hydroxymethylpyrimidine pyrophosphatase-like HAD family hydrolase